LEALNFTIFMIFGAVTGYCFLRVLLYPVLNFLVDETELYSNPKHKKIMNIFYHARLYPWPIWDEEKRTNWVRAWWKFALIGLASFIIQMIALYFQDSIK